MPSFQQNIDKALLGMQGVDPATQRWINKQVDTRKVSYGDVNAPILKRQIENAMPFAEFGAGFTPLLGDVLSAIDAYNSAMSGNYGDAALNSMGLLPFIPSISNISRTVPKIGVNINDKVQPFTDQILQGIKTIETRNSPSLLPYVGQRVGIVRTGKGKAMLVGYADVGEPVLYDTVQDFRNAYEQHLVPEGSKFDIKDKKYGFPFNNVESIDPVPVQSRGIISRKINTE